MITGKFSNLFALSLITGVLLAGSAFAADQGTLYPEGSLDKEVLVKILPDKPPYSPYAGRNFPTRPLFGDTHVHTSYSLDGGTAGCRLGPVEALSFAKDEEIMASSR